MKLLYLFVFLIPLILAVNSEKLLSGTWTNGLNHELILIANDGHLKGSYIVTSENTIHEHTFSQSQLYKSSVFKQNPYKTPFFNQGLLKLQGNYQIGKSKQNATLGFCIQQVSKDIYSVSCWSGVLRPYDFSSDIYSIDVVWVITYLQNNEISQDTGSDQFMRP